MFDLTTKGGFLGRNGSLPGNLIPAGVPAYEDYIRAHGTLVNYWPMFADKAGSTEVDVTGGVVGTYAGSPTDAVGGYVTEGATVFGSGGRMTTPALGISRGAVEFWCKISSNPVTGANKGLLFGLVDSSVAYDKIVYLDSTGAITFAIQQVATNTVSSATTLASALAIGRWNHIVCVQDSSTGLSIYINGSLAKNQPVATAASRTNLTTGAWLAGTGATLGFVDVPGTYCNLALYSGTSALSAANILVHYNAGLSTGLAGARVTQSVIEVLRNSSTRKARVTQSVIEVLRTSATGFIYTASATNAFTVHPDAAKNRVALASAAASFNIGFASTGLVGHQYSVSAETDMLIGATDTAVRNVVSSASSAILFDRAATEIRDTISSASSAFLLSPTSSEAGDFAVSSSSSFGVGAAAPYGARDVFSDAASAILLDNLSSNALTHAFAKSASSSFNFTVDANAIPVTHKLVSGASAITLHSAASFVANRVATATTRVLFGMNFYGRKDPATADALASLEFSADASALVIGAKPVSASSSLSLSIDAEAMQLYVVAASAASGLVLSPSSREVAAFAVTSTSGFVVRPAVKGGRIIHVHAETSMGLVSGDDSNEFFYIGATTNVLIGMVAAVSVGGKEASSSIVFTDLAIARVHFPWRFRPLTLPPAGGLPHS